MMVGVFESLDMVDADGRRGEVSCFSCGSTGYPTGPGTEGEGMVYQRSFDMKRGANAIHEVMMRMMLGLMVKHSSRNETRCRHRSLAGEVTDGENGL